MENATVVLSRGIITAVGKDVAIPPEAWVIDGKGLTVLSRSHRFFHRCWHPAAAPSGGEGGPRRPQEAHAVRRPSRLDAVAQRGGRISLSDKRIETWRNAGFTTVVSAPKGDSFPGRPPCSIWRRARRGSGRQSPVAIPVSLQISGGSAADFPIH